MSLCLPSHHPHSLFPPLFHSSFFSPCSCPWRTPHQSCLGWRGTQMPMASGLWLSLLCQVCQVCVCAGSGKRPHAGAAPLWAQESAWYPSKGPPSITSFSLWHICRQWLLNWHWRNKSSIKQTAHTCTRTLHRHPAHYSKVRWVGCLQNYVAIDF